MSFHIPFLITYSERVDENAYRYIFCCPVCLLTKVVGLRYEGSFFSFVIALPDELILSQTYGLYH